MAEIPMIISVDDHVVEPAHLWQTWLPEKHRADAPYVERHGLGGLKYVGGTTYEYELTDDGRALLHTWAEALRGAAETIEAFLARYEAKGGDHVPR